MCKFIGVEDLAANALIELIENEISKSVTFEQLNKYGDVIVKLLNKDNKSNEKAVLLINKYHTSEMIFNYTDYFEIENFETENPSIKLKDGKHVNDLRNNFRSYMSVEMLIAFTDDKVLSVLGINKISKKGEL